MEFFIVWFLIHRGKRCEVEIDFCTPNPCRHNSTCSNVKYSTAFKCNCTAGYEGKSCEIDTNECEPNPCRNGGTCKDLVSVVCTCRSLSTRPPSFFNHELLKADESNFFGSARQLNRIFFKLWILYKRLLSWILQVYSNS